MKYITSKTFWTGVSAIAAGCFALYAGNIEGGITGIIGGLGLIFVRDAISNLEK